MGLKKQEQSSLDAFIQVEFFFFKLTWHSKTTFKAQNTGKQGDVTLCQQQQQKLVDYGVNTTKDKGLIPRKNM